MRTGGRAAPRHAARRCRRRQEPARARAPLGARRHRRGVLVGRCLPYGQGITLWPLAEILKSEAGILDTDPSSVALAKLEQLVERELGDGLRRPHTVAALASTLGLRPPGDPLGALDPREAYRELVAAWRVLLVAIARRGQRRGRRRGHPLGGRHDARRPRRARRARRGADLLPLPGTARPAAHAAGLGRWPPQLQLAAARPVDEPSRARASSRRCSTSTSCRRRVRERILERSEGNPFFLEEIVHHLIDEGLLVDDGRPLARRGRHRRGRDPRHRPGGAPRQARSAGAGGEARRAAGGRGRPRLLGRGGRAARGRRRRRCRAADASPPRARARSQLVRRSRGRASSSSSTSSSATSPTRACRGGSAAARTPSWRRGSRRRAASARPSSPSCSPTIATQAFSSARRRRAAPAGARPLPRRRGRRPTPLCDPAERAVRRSGRSSSRSDEAERVEALEALGDLHYRTFNGDGAWRAYRDALAALPAGRPRDREAGRQGGAVRGALVGNGVRASSRGGSPSRSWTWVSLRRGRATVRSARSCSSIEASSSSNERSGTPRQSRAPCGTPRPPRSVSATRTSSRPRSTSSWAGSSPRAVTGPGTARRRGGPCTSRG